ncbi:MAG: acyltransferase [Desulfobacterales bacterium]|nr:acyltransferase [Desulfobacterales bacterium]
MNSNLWPARLYALDVSRSIAALSVVFWHWQHFAYNGTFPPDNVNRSNQPLYGLFRIFYEKGSMGVDYFFLLSGFIFFWLYKKPVSDRDVTFLNFWLQRFSRLYPLHFVTLIVVGLLQYIYLLRNSSFFVYPFNDIRHFILNISFASHWGLQNGWSFNAPIWSVSIEIILYLLFFIVAYSHYGDLVFCLLVSFASYAAFYKLHHDIFRGLSMFFLGGFVFQFTSIMFLKYRPYIKIIYITAIISWLMVFLNYYLWSLASFIGNLDIVELFFHKIFPIYILFPATVCSLALAEIVGDLNLRPISWVGDITYSSYLLHFPLQLVFGLALSYGAISSSTFNKPIFLLIFFSLLISLSYLTFIYFERPMQRVIRERCSVRGR